MSMHLHEENLLEHLQCPEFSQLRSIFTTRLLVKNAFVSQPDSEENIIFIVNKGRVRVYLGYEDKEFNLAILNPGDIYSTHAGTYVQAIEEVELLVTDVTTFRQQMVSDGDVNKAIIKVLGNILKASFTIIDGLVFKDATCRLLSLLLTEAKRRQASPEGEIVLDINLSVEQIAQLVGASRQTVSTQLNKLLAKGIIERKKRGTFIIPDLEALENHYEVNECL